MAKPEPSANVKEALTSKQAEAKFASLLSSPSQEETQEPQDQQSETAEQKVEPTPPESSDIEASDEPTFEITVDGKTEVVDLEELKAGYSRDADYRRKTMALADERKTFETEAETLRRERAQYQQGLAQLHQALEQLQGEPDWDQLHAELEPAEFLKQKAEWERGKAAREKIRAEQDRLAQTQAQEFEAARLKTLRAEQDKLKLAIPDWNDQEKAKSEMAKLVAHAKTYGFTDQEVAQVVDHRTVLLLRDAMKYRELHRDVKPQAKVSSIKTAKPGTPDRPRPGVAQEKLVERLTKTGRSVDAAKLIESLLPD